MHSSFPRSRREAAVQPVTEGMCLLGVEGAIQQVASDPATVPPLKIRTRSDRFVTISTEPGTCFGTASLTKGAAVVNETCKCSSG